MWNREGRPDRAALACFSGRIDGTYRNSATPLIPNHEATTTSAIPTVHHVCPRVSLREIEAMLLRPS
jgi:hypothetical protein